MIRQHPSSNFGFVLLLCDTHVVVWLLALRRYRRFRQSAFGNCGALLTRTGINDDAVAIEGAPNFHPPAPGTILHDAAFENDSGTGAAAFNFSYDIAGGNDEAGPDCSDSENPSEAESESHDSSSDTSDKF